VDSRNLLALVCFFFQQPITDWLLDRSCDWLFDSLRGGLVDFAPSPLSDQNVLTKMGFPRLAFKGMVPFILMLSDIWNDFLCTKFPLNIGIKINEIRGK